MNTEAQEFIDYPEEEASMSARDYLAILKRHKGKMLLTAMLVFITSLALAIFLPPTYQSTATILIEQPIISADLVQSTVSSYADQQVQRIRQRVLSRPNLKRIIEKFSLYKKDLKTESWSTVIENMEQAVAVEMISADVLDARGKATKATIAFQVSFSDQSAAISQRVANELVSLFMQENLKERSENAAEASSFFEREANVLKKRMEEIDKKMVTLKEERGSSLPEFQHQNNAQLERAYQRLEDINSLYRRAYERKFSLESQLAQIDPFGSSSNPIIDDKTRIKKLQLDYSNLLARYAPNHPDVVKLRNEIESLNEHSGAATSRQSLMLALKEKRSENAHLKQNYSDEHPDMQRVAQEIKSLEQQLNELPKEGYNTVDTESADNPAYIQTKAQLQTASMEITSLEKTRKELENRVELYESRLIAAPDVERQYKELMRDYTDNKSKYEQIRAKLTSVNLAESVEKNRKGERYTLSEPPELPEEPIKPNRKAIVALGTVLAAAAAIALAMLFDTMNQTVHGTRQLSLATGETPLASIPYLETHHENEQRSKKQRKNRLVILLGLFIAALLIYALFAFGGIRLIAAFERLTGLG